VEVHLPVLMVHMQCSKWMFAQVKYSVCVADVHFAAVATKIVPLADQAAHVEHL
jgi:hypothetical protein